MPHLSLSFLGPFQVALDGRPVTQFRADTVRALLAYLAVEAQRSHRRDSLAGLLWPEEPDAVARQNLRQALSLLRKAIGDRQSDSPFLQVTRKTVQLNVEGGIAVDVATFTGLLAACEGHRHRRVDGCPSCAERLRHATDLYRGDLLAGFSLPSAPFEEWLVTEREHLHLRALDALHQLAAYHERRGEQERVCHYARRQLELEPWREAAHRQLMRALALSDQRGGALAQYEQCRRQLMEELAVAPEEETSRLYAQIRSAKDASELRPLSLAPPHNLPAGLTPLIGRETALAEIEGCLQDPGCRLLTLVGPGGSGKTRLAVEAAAQAVDRYEHGVFFVPLASLGSAEAIVPAVARVLGFPFYAGGEPRQQVLDYLRGKAMLLVLDNYEHLLEGAGLVAEILQAAPRVLLLVTSRTRLGLSGEQLFPVGALTLPEAPARTPTEWHAIAASTQSAAVRLFVSAAQRAWPDFELTADNLSHVIRVCRLVEGMPLGILLAAAWANLLQPAEIALELARSLDFLTAEWRDLPPRQRSMRAVFDHSWRLLTGREQEVMGALSVFRGSFGRDAAQEVAGATLHELMGLVNRSLLAHTPGGRYDLHELLRQYAAEQLERSPDAGAAVRARHAGHYVAALERWAEDLKGRGQRVALAEIEADLDNTRAAWEWAVGRGAIEVLDRAADALGLFYDRQMRLEEGQAVFGPAADALAGADAADTLRVRVRMLSWRACFTLEQEPVNSTVRQCLALLDGPELADQDTRRERALALQQVGKRVARLLITDEGYSPHIVRQLEQSLALYRDLGDRWQVSDVLFMLAAVKMSPSRDEAEPFMEEGLAIARELGDQIGTARYLLQMAGYSISREGADRKDSLAREAIGILQEIGDRFGSAQGLNQLGVRLYYQGGFAEAFAAEQESARLLDDLGRRHNSMMGTELWLGATEMQLGRYEEAREHIQNFSITCNGLDSKSGLLYARRFLGVVAMATGQYAQADVLLQESLTVAGELRYVSVVGELLGYLACNACKMARPLHARQYLFRALSIASDGGYRVLTLLPVVTTALLLAEEGHPEPAVELYALASCDSFVANSRWFEDVAGKGIAAAAEGLAPEVVEAARERGRARDLWETARELLEELETE